MELGDGYTLLKNSFVMVMIEAQAIAAGYEHSVVLKQDADTGRNNIGRLATRPKTFTSTFMQVIDREQGHTGRDCRRLT